MLRVKSCEKSIPADLEQRPLPKKVGECTASSIESLAQSPSLWQRFFSYIYSFFQWIEAKIAPTLKELEIFEHLLETTFNGGVAFLYDQKLGEKELENALKSCDFLINALAKKWFPNLESILFMHKSILKLKIRILAALKQEAEILIQRNKLKELGGDLSKVQEGQMEKILFVCKHPYYLKWTNKVVQFGVFLIKEKPFKNGPLKGLLILYRGRRDSNPQLPP